MSWIPEIEYDVHDQLFLSLCALTLPRPLGELELDWALAQTNAQTLSAQLKPEHHDQIKTDLRDLLKLTGFKPNGRNKPSSEYLHKANLEGRMSPEHSINALVDCANFASLHSGLPISVIDADAIVGSTLTAAACPPGCEFVFNPSGQSLSAGGLLALHDEAGPTATPVKDAQRTKTHEDTQRALLVIWSCPKLLLLADATYEAITDTLETLHVSHQRLSRHR